MDKKRTVHIDVQLRQCLGTNLHSDTSTCPIQMHTPILHYIWLCIHMERLAGGGGICCITIFGSKDYFNNLVNQMRLYQFEFIILTFTKFYSKECSDIILGFKDKVLFQICNHSINLACIMSKEEAVVHVNQTDHISMDEKTWLYFILIKSSCCQYVSKLFKPC